MTGLLQGAARPAERLLHADLHGALVEVLAAADPRHVGVKGIVCGESSESLSVVTLQDTAVRVPLRNTEFRMYVGQGMPCFTLIGSHFRQERLPPPGKRKRY